MLYFLQHVDHNRGFPFHNQLWNPCLFFLVESFQDSFKLYYIIGVMPYEVVVDMSYDSLFRAQRSSISCWPWVSFRHSIKIYLYKVEGSRVLLSPTFWMRISQPFHTDSIEVGQAQCFDYFLFIAWNVSLLFRQLCKFTISATLRRSPFHTAWVSCDWLLKPCLFLCFQTLHINNPGISFQARLRVVLVKGSCDHPLTVETTSP